MYVNLLVLKHRDKVVTLADEDEDVTWVHGVVLHYVHDEQEVAPIVIKYRNLSVGLDNFCNVFFKNVQNYS